MKTTHNSTFAIGGVLCSADSFAVTESSVLRINYFTEKPAHRKSANRYMKKLLILLFISTLPAVFAQQDVDPFDKYGPPGMVYTNLKDAIPDAGKVFKLQLENQVLDPKLLPKLATFTEMQALELNSNGLTQLPVEFNKLKSLIYFASIANPLTSLPTEIKDIPDLMELRLHSTKLDSIPASIAYLGRLQNIDIQNNTSAKLSFPTSMGYLAGLKTLLVYNTKLDTLPSSFANLKKMKDLTLVMCGLNQIPYAVTQMTAMEQLTLDNNNIKQVPNELYKLKSLKYLSLKNNKISAISDAVCLLKNLEVLDLRGNLIKKYDAEILQALLPNCRVLY